MQAFKPLQVGAFVSAILFAGVISAKADIFGSVLPTSRAVQVNTTATAFATIINASASPATNCRLTIPASIPANFSYQTTNASTNAPTGSMMAL